MNRHRLRQQILYGHFREYIEIVEALNVLARERGWTESTLWTPTVGASNEVIVETEFPDLATFQRQNEAFYSDAEVMGGPPTGSGASYRSRRSDRPQNRRRTRAKHRYGEPLGEPRVAWKER